jgi:hypothetical protein
LCYKSLDEINIEISSKISNKNALPVGYKKIPDETKLQVASLIKSISSKGLIVSVSIPVHLFEHCESKKKVTSVCYALINTILNKVLSEKNKAGIEIINIYLISRGELNSGINSRISRIVNETLSSATKVERKILKFEENDDRINLDQILGLTCWFINQQSSQENSKWLHKIKA